ncbi:cell division protein ZapE [Kitasatospora sp. NPDC048365]|uniref:cell division protein ZapE n=1 Tax=Kitasatospora sp. NPDC048365 TaxID=3364050 RepID=UPI00371E65B5
MVVGTGEFTRAAERDGLVLDEGQLAVAARLAGLGSALGGRRRLFGRATAPVRGVYLWGSVGRGKSWLADTLFDAVPLTEETEKRRLHFHEFFRRFHTAYGRYRGERAASDRAVEELLGDCRFLYFDEFHVHDAGDAMLIGRVVRSLLARGTTLLATSNYPPAGLLPNPVFHQLFEPVIALLEASLDVVELTDGQDYRTSRGAGRPRSGFAAGRYLWPGTEHQLTDAGLTVPTADERRPLRAGTGKVEALAVRDGQIWFDFHELCDRPVSTGDYLELADTAQDWVLTGLPRLAETNRDAAQRFANLIDVLCDREIPLTLVSRASLAEVLRGDGLPADINRTASRLSLLEQHAPAGADRSLANESAGRRGADLRSR